MKITLNGQNKDFTDNLSLSQLIDEVSAGNKRIIAEINGNIVKKETWDETVISDGDEIELVTFVGGG